MINSIKPSFGAYLKFKIPKKEFGTDKISKENELYIKTDTIKYIERNPQKNSYFINTPDFKLNFIDKKKDNRNLAEEIIAAQNDKTKIIDLTDCEI